MKVITYNCQGVNLKQRPTLSALLNDKDNDIICLQETWLTKQDLGRLNTLHSDFHGIGKSTTDIGDGLIHGHPPGGVAILWRTSLSAQIDVISLDCDWICGVTVKSQSASFVILCIYLPCFLNTPEREDHYLSCLGSLHSIIEDIPTTSMFIVGDWNADILRRENSFGPHLELFCDDQKLFLSSKCLLPPDSFTYVSPAWNTTSWLDHCVSTADAHTSIQDISILYEHGTYDHLPVCIDVALSFIPATTIGSNNFLPKLDWSTLRAETVLAYTAATDDLLSHVHVPLEAVACNDPMCTDTSHRQLLDKFYNDIVTALHQASAATIHRQNVGTSFKSHPGWSDYVADYYDASRESFLLWAANGKPRQGPLFEDMKKTRAQFKYALRFVKNNEKTLRSDALAKKFTSTNPRAFWKEIKRINSTKLPLPHCINGTSGCQEIANLWRDHYRDLFNCVLPCGTERTYHCDSAENMCITPKEVVEAIGSLRDNKATGMDSISGEHLKHSSQRVVFLLSLCFSSLFVHGYMPHDMISVLLIPIVKDKNVSLSSKSNYRPIALASVISKVVETIILNRTITYLHTESNQFGFKPKMGTDMPIYLLKEIVEKYTLLKGNIFMCFLDASKAFDRVNHFTLFDKLLRRGVPQYIVRLLDFWYTNQTMCVSWSGCLSDEFKVSNGVRQGGILSPFLFNVYVDDLSKLLNTCTTGCMIGGSLINHVMYADDLVVFSPCADGLSYLLSKCEMFGINHDIVYNSKKSAILLYRNEALNSVDDTSIRFMLNNQVIPIVDKVKYLGHYLCDNLKDDSDLQRQRRMLYAQANLLKHRFYMCTEPVKVKLFKTFCYCLYTAPLWWNYTLYSYRKVRVAYNDAFRNILNVPRFTSASQLFVSNRVFTLDGLVRHLLARFIKRLDDCTNLFICAINTSDLKYQSRIRKFWITKLYNTQM